MIKSRSGTNNEKDNDFGLGADTKKVYMDNDLIGKFNCWQYYADSGIFCTLLLDLPNILLLKWIVVFIFPLTVS